MEWNQYLDFKKARQYKIEYFDYKSCLFLNQFNNMHVLCKTNIEKGKGKSFTDLLYNVQSICGLNFSYK